MSVCAKLQYSTTQWIGGGYSGGIRQAAGGRRGFQLYDSWWSPMKWHFLRQDDVPQASCSVNAGKTSHLLVTHTPQTRPFCLISHLGETCCGKELEYGMAITMEKVTLRSRWCWERGVTWRRNKAGRAVGAVNIASSARSLRKKKAQGCQAKSRQRCMALERSK